MDDQRYAWYAYVELTHRYADGVDRGAGAEVAALFIPDGRWDGTVFSLAVVTGTEALTRHFSPAGDQPASVHLVHNHLVEEVSASRVVARSYAHAMLPRETGLRHLIVGYEDVLKPVDGEWRFAERVLRRGLSY